MVDEPGARDPNSAGDGGATAAAGNGANGTGWEPKEIVVRGKKVRLETLDDALNFAQKGVRMEQALAEVKEKEQSLAAREAELDRLRKVDEMLRNDPRKRARVNAALQDLPDPEPPVDDDDPYAKSNAELRREVRGLRDLVEDALGGVTRNVGALNTERRLDREEREVRRQFRHATDDDMDDAREMVARGEARDLASAFRLIDYDRQPARVRADVERDFGDLPARFTPRKAETLSLEGIGVVDDRTMQNLYDDPERYARYRDQLRAHRRARSGKLPFPK